MSEYYGTEPVPLATQRSEHNDDDETSDSSTALPALAIPERERAPYSTLGPRIARVEKTETSAENKDQNDQSVPLFSCRICLDTASDPVVTNCGHLYCFECLISWFEAQPSLESCPVCKSHCTREKLTPIYGCGREEKDPRTRERNRPRPKTTPAPSSQASARSPFGWFDDWTMRNRTDPGVGGGGNNGITFHAGFLPFLGLGVGFQIPIPIGNENTTNSNRNTNSNNARNASSSDEEDSAQISRYFLMRILVLLTLVFVLPRLFG